MGGIEGIRLCLAGASVGNGNRGVEALGRSVLDVVDSESYSAQITVFDDGWGVRADSTGRYRQAVVEYAGVRVSRRWHRPESWTQIRVAQRLSGFGNPVARKIAECDALLDISGGDSFTDLYGQGRLRAVTAPKEAALRAGRPLVFLPQTYGPFSTPNSRRIAERLIRRAAVAYARDTASYHRLLELAGPDADGSRLVDGVDVAFALKPRRPRHTVADEIDSIAAVLPDVPSDSDTEPLVGVNISGLLRDSDAAERFGLRGDYLATMRELVEALLAAGVRVLFIPHVHVPGGGGESDMAAVDQVLAALPTATRSRTLVAPPEFDAAELKWCISHCSWFVGSRMHSTIAALSSQVPACGYAYSDKTRGVFETCRAGDHVQDARKISGPDAVEAIMASFHDRAVSRRELAAHVPGVVQRARDQLGGILTAIGRWREHPGSAGTVGNGL